MAVIVMTSSFTVEAGFSGERRGPRPTHPATQPALFCVLLCTETVFISFSCEFV